MAKEFSGYWRVREQIYRTTAASCVTAQTCKAWLALAEDCARRAESIEHGVLPAAGIQPLPPHAAADGTSDGRLSDQLQRAERWLDMARAYRVSGAASRFPGAGAAYAALADACESVARYVMR
jgi:hypothetical protein